MNKSKNIMELTKEHFGFLVTEYGFVYNRTLNTFTNGKISIYISQIDRELPVIKLWLLSEPEFTCIEIDWLLKEYITYSDIDKNLLDKNLAYYAYLFHAHADKLIHKTISLLLPALKRYFINFIRGYVSAYKVSIDKYLHNLSAEDKMLFAYIKTKDPDWDPSKEL